MEMKELKKIADGLSSEELILDVRGVDEFADGHVPGSRNIPHDEVILHLDELKPFKKIYLYCRSGRRVQMACDALKKQGITQIVGVTTGGMPEWIDAGFPVEN